MLLDVKRPGERDRARALDALLVRARRCVEPYGDWTRVTAEKAASCALSTRFSPERLFQRGDVQRRAPDRAVRRRVALG